VSPVTTSSNGPNVRNTCDSNHANITRIFILNNKNSSSSLVLYFYYISIKSFRNLPSLTV
jgi:hypothetical protein